MANRFVTSASPYEVTFGFCRARRQGNRILVAGTAPIGDDGQTVCVGDPVGQARRCFEIIRRALGDLGGSLDDVVRTRMYLTHIEDWKQIASVHGEFFGGQKDRRPVATIVAVAALIDPEWSVEVEAEAVVE